MKKIEHIGIAVKDLEASNALFGIFFIFQKTQIKKNLYTFVATL